MNQDIIPTVKPTLEEIREQFIAWRSSRRSSREPIPDALWDAAVSLSGEYSIGRISKVLSLGHSDLKRRVQEQGDNGYKGEKDGSYRFVEFAIDRPGSASECVMEMEDNKGGKLKVHLKGGIGFNLVEVAEAFWKREP
jgi:hypothetical protein